MKKKQKLAEIKPSNILLEKKWQINESRDKRENQELCKTKNVIKR